ncbi:MAG: TonB-dependent receptor [Panacagrimonas sp.]
MLETITITADPFARTADELVQPAEILSGEALDRRRGASLGETLEHELGVSSTDFGRGAGRPVIRGQGGPRVLMLENGIASMDASDVSADHEVSIDPAHAEQIEILKGPATLMYGSSASAGVVNVVDGGLPSEVTEGLASSLRGSFGSNADERSAAGRLAYGFGGTQLHLDGAFLEADDYDIDGNSAVDGSGNDGRLLNSAVEKSSGSVSAARFGEAGSLAASYARYETEYGLPVEEEAFIDLEQERIDLEGRWLRPFQGVDSLRLRAARGDYEHTEFEAPGEPGTVFKNDQTDARFELVHAPLAGWRGVLGVQTRDREFQAIGEEAFVPSTDTRALGVFLLEERATSFGRVELGLRTDRDRAEPQDGVNPDRRFTPFSASAGVLFELNAHYHLKLYVTRAERSPVSEELYSFGPHLATASFERGDDALDIETASNFEIGIDRHGGPLGWRVNLYRQDVAEYIVQNEVDAGLNADGSGAAASDGEADRVDEEGLFDPDGELLLLDYRAADARFWGAEGELTYAWQVGATELRARAFGDLARGRLDQGGNLPRITPARVGLGLHAHRGPWSTSLDLTRVDAQDRVASLETRTDGYSMLSVDADYQLPLSGASVRLFLRGRNLLDEDARRHTSFIKDFAPLPGASVVAGLEWRLE